MALGAAALLLAPLAACSAITPHGFPALPGSGADSSSSSSSSSSSGSSEDFGARSDLSSKSGAEASSEAAIDTADGAEASGATAERSVIRTGSIDLQVGDPADGVNRVADLVEQFDGVVETEDVSRGGDGVSESASLTIRVPEARMDEAFDALAKLGTVQSQSRSASDVTAEHVDLQARVDALTTSVKRLTKLMEGSASTSELIEAESALSQRQQELDGLRAQLNALEGQVDEATIYVTLNSPSALPGGGPANFWEGLIAGFASLGSAGAGALVLLGVLLPWLALGAIIAAIVWLLVRSARRRRAHRAHRTGPADGTDDTNSTTELPHPTTQSTTAPPGPGQ